MTRTKEWIREKRRRPRKAVGITMGLAANKKAAGRLDGTVMDLSDSGMALETSLLLEEGSVIVFRIKPPLEIRGEIRHIKPGTAEGRFRYGVRFLRIGYDRVADGRTKFISAKFR